MIRSKLLSALCVILLAVFLLTFSLAVPILYRPFYYANVDKYALETGYSQDTIIKAYDQVLDYLVLGKAFGTGELKHSPDGAAHFADCRILFRLNFILLGVSAALLTVIYTICKQRGASWYRVQKRGVCFWTLIVLAAVFVGVVIWALIDFNALFTAFHTTFFPGKDNWIFDPRYDEIINILPIDFWASAGAFVVGLCMGLAALLAVIEKRLHKKKER